jgi:CheY-like chemotaxis protein
LNLPRIHGIEVLAYVKGHPLLNKVPVFVISNSDYHKDISNCSDLSADGYIQKPNDFKDLVDLASAIKKSLLSNTAIVPEILLAEYASIKAAC